MDQQEIRSILEQVAQGKRSVDEAVLALKMEPFKELGFAKVDNHRGLRQGAAEVIYGAGKTPQQIRDIAASMRETGEKMCIRDRYSTAVSLFNSVINFTLLIVANAFSRKYTETGLF